MKTTSNRDLNFDGLKKLFSGDIYTDLSSRLMYATDASAYREIPIAVTRPKNKQDIINLIEFARRENTSLIPRSAGTSLAGQVVGAGIIVDISKYMNRILEFNRKEQWVRVEPGVILDELNMELKKDGLFFAPETSTSDRCMIGGMVANNSCGAHSLIYGSTRDHLISLKVILSDGSVAEFGPIDQMGFGKMCKNDKLEGNLYKNIDHLLSSAENIKEIRDQYPDSSIKRRNTGYAIDILAESDIFSRSGKPFNFAKLLAGSEGTLAFIIEIKLNLLPLPPKEKGLLCVHFHSIEEALQGNLIALNHKPGAIELMDNYVLEQTKNNIAQRKNRFFLKGEPAAILIIEFARDTTDEIGQIAFDLEKDLRSHNLGYHFPLITGNNIHRIWALRKAGLGVLSHVAGDAKPVPVIEDTAVKPEDLPSYLAEFGEIMKKHQLSCVYHGHIATGELHLRPVLNLKDKQDVELFRIVAKETAQLVKKYNGSLSGEHGDGRLRGEFIPLMIGNKNYELLLEIKKAWDPDNIFNPGKIVHTPAMNSSLRYVPGTKTREIDTIFDFSANMGILRAVEECNGSGDCRKSALIGGIMCPSYMASKDENNSTRARANILREFLTGSTKANPFNHEEIYDVMDLCLSCKGCKSECPSSVDITKLKAEFLQHYYDDNGIPLRTKLIANFHKINNLFSYFPSLYNAVAKNPLLSGAIKSMLRFADERQLPMIQKTRVKKWHNQFIRKNDYVANSGNRVFLFLDEFTRFQDADTGVKAIELLYTLGYDVIIPDHTISGRTYLSKGLLRKAKRCAEKNVTMLSDLVSEETPLIGIEPSCILTFRDEYPELVSKKHHSQAKKLAASTMLFEEFFMSEVSKGKISKVDFTNASASIKLHGHCYQKSLASTEPTLDMLSLPENYSVEEIQSGCCGMAGSFGYEKEHYELSMQIGELVLFPSVRESEEKTIIAAPGTSCRQQISDGTGRKAFHPIDIMYAALQTKKNPAG